MASVRPAHKSRIFFHSVAVFRTAVLLLLCGIWIFPLFRTLFSSEEAEYSKKILSVFADCIHTVSSFGFLLSAGRSVLLTALSVLLLLLFSSMCSWYISRVSSPASGFVCFLCLLSVVIPFQSVVLQLSGTAEVLHLNPYFSACMAYLCSGMGFAVFLFLGFLRSIPLAIEEAAMIDGCSPLQIFFCIDLPILRPALITAGVLETSWIWSDRLIPELLLNRPEYQTLPVLLGQLCSAENPAGSASAYILFSVVPVFLLFLLCRRYVFGTAFSLAKR